MMTDTQMEAFHGGRLHTPFINCALAESRDPTLQAKVYHYRAQQKKVRQRAQGVVEARRKLQVERTRLRNSARCLSDANAYARLYPKVRYDYLTLDEWTQSD